ncbi:right-handed parallel beta-helix repeat-containing protein, partial [Verrucomicrobiota bacterium]
MIQTKRLVLGAVWLMLFVTCLGASAPPEASRIVYVDGAGAEAEEGTRVGPFRTIEAALKVSEEGVIVRIAAGVYRENLVVVTPGLRLVGAGSGKTIIDAAKGCGIKIRADGVSIADLSVRNAGKPAAVHVEKCGKVTISGCAVSDSPTTAFRCDKARDVEILDNTISSCNEGVYLVASTRCTMKRNVMTKCKGALRVHNRPAKIDTNKPEHFNHTIDETNTWNGKAIYYRFRAKNETIENCDPGILWLVLCDKMTLRNLTFDRSCGAVLVQTHNSTIEKSTFSKCSSWGMYILYSKHNVIKNNVFRDNPWGLRFEQSEEQVTQNNVFVDNKSRGIAPWHSETCHVIGNKVSGSEIGIMFKDCLLSSAVDNEVRDCTLFGIELATYWGVVKQGNKLLNNRVDNAKYGLYIWGGKNKGLKKDTTVSGNIVANCKIGLGLYWAKDTKVSDNTFLNVKHPMTDNASAKNTTTTNTEIGIRLKVAVVDTKGQPVSGVEVRAVNSEGAEGSKVVTTGKDGRVELDLILEFRKSPEDVVSYGPYAVKATKGEASATVAVDPKGSRDI